jgi:hypothetical protein
MWPLVASLSIATSMGIFGYTLYSTNMSLLKSLIFFIPNSSDTVTSLDQAVALGTGGVTLLRSIYYAWRSRRNHHK